jgi:hypothetical protein
MKEMNDLKKIKIPFEWKYLMTLHTTWIEFELNKFNSTIGLKFNRRKMKCKFVKNVWKFAYEYGVEEENFKRTQIWKGTFPCLIIGEWISKLANTK